MRLRFAIIGGALDSFMGPVHRAAAMLDGQAELAAGAFSRDPAKNGAAAAAWHVPPDRVHSDYHDLLDREQGRLDYVIVATPNNTHVEIALAALRAGYPVVSDKPLGISSQEGGELKRVIRETGGLYMLTHNYTGYPMVKEARAMVRGGAVGTIQRVVVEMPQGWLQGIVAATGREPDMWRLRPEIVGPSLITADVGTHALHMAEYVTGLRATHVLADFSATLTTSALETDANILLRFNNGSSGALLVSNVATGDRNPFRLRVYGTRAGIEWVQETPEVLIVKESSGNERRYFRGHAPDAESTRWSRLPIGHPEGYLEAFANLYGEFHRAVRDRSVAATCDIPGVDDGIHGLRFIEAAVRSATAPDGHGVAWQEIDGPDGLGPA